MGHGGPCEVVERVAVARRELKPLEGSARSRTG